MIPEAIRELPEQTQIIGPAQDAAGVEDFGEIKRRLELEKLKAEIEKIQFDQRTKVYDIMRDCIKHEDNLINYRTTWGQVPQGFLLGIFAAALRESGYRPTAGSTVIAVVGLILAFLTTIGVYAALTAIRNLRDHCKLQLAGRKGDPKAGIYRVGSYHLPMAIGGGKKLAATLGVLSSGALPVLFLVGWFALLCWSVEAIDVDVILHAIWTSYGQ